MRQDRTILREKLMEGAGISDTVRGRNTFENYVRILMKMLVQTDHQFYKVNRQNYLR